MRPSGFRRLNGLVPKAGDTEPEALPPKDLRRLQSTEDRTSGLMTRRY